MVSKNGLSGIHTAKREDLPLVPQFRQSILPFTEDEKATVKNAREAIKLIYEGKDPRILVVHGPCSADDIDEARRYIDWTAETQPQVKDQFKLCVRLCGEKPRTSEEDWEGLIYEPFLDGERNIIQGLYMVRELYKYAASKGVAVAAENLSILFPAWINDGVTLGWGGARSVAYQDLQNMVSTLSNPFGFKNDLTGDVGSAIRAIKKARQANRTFLGIDIETGLPAQLTGKGNPYTFPILRGGETGPNYDVAHVAEAQRLLRDAALQPKLLIDCSHGNSGKEKDYRKQPEVFINVSEQIVAGNDGIFGIMVEAYNREGSVAKKIPKDRHGFDHKTLEMGSSRTDGCVSRETLGDLLRTGAEYLRTRSRTTVQPYAPTTSPTA